MTNAKTMTVSGKWIDLLDMRVEDVDIEDCAHHLAWTCRYGGAVRDWYCNAQHCILVDDIVAQLVDSGAGDPFLDFDFPPAISPNPRVLTRLAALVHDAGETYTHDITNPVKRALRFVASFYGMKSPLDVLEDRVHVVVERAFGLPYGSLHSSAVNESALARAIRGLVKQADNLALRVEEHYLRPETEEEFPERLDPAKLCLQGGEKPWDRFAAREQFLDRYRYHQEALPHGA